MKHRDAVPFLSDLAAGGLDPEVARRVAAHAEACRACSEWLHSYRHFEKHLVPSPMSRETHPESHLLALWALSPGELTEAIRRQVRRHLESCRPCRKASQLTSEAVRQARSGEAGKPVPRRAGGLRTWLPLAAVFAALLVGAALLFQAMLRVQPLIPSPVTTASGRHELLDRSTALTEVVVSNREFEGVEVVHADRSLSVAHSGVAPGAAVTFSAGDVVAFGNGFKVARGGRITVTSGRSDRLDPNIGMEPR